MVSLVVKDVEGGARLNIPVFAIVFVGNTASLGLVSAILDIDPFDFAFAGWAYSEDPPVTWRRKDTVRVHR